MTMESRINSRENGGKRLRLVSSKWPFRFALSLFTALLCSESRPNDKQTSDALLSFASAKVYIFGPFVTHGGASASFG